MWQKQLNYSIFILLYCHVKSSEFVGLWSKKTTSLNLKGLWHAFEHLAAIWLLVKVSWFLVKKSFSIDLVREKVLIISIDNITYLVNCLCTVFLITQTSATNVQCEYCDRGHRRQSWPIRSQVNNNTFQENW